MRPLSVEETQGQCDGAILGPSEVSRVRKASVGIADAPQAELLDIRYDMEQRRSPAWPFTMQGQAVRAFAPTEPVSPYDSGHVPPPASPELKFRAELRSFDSRPR